MVRSLSRNTRQSILKQSTHLSILRRASQARKSNLQLKSATKLSIYGNLHRKTRLLSICRQQWQCQCLMFTHRRLNTCAKLFITGKILSFLFIRTMTEEQLWLMPSWDCWQEETGSRVHFLETGRELVTWISSHWQ